MLRTRDIREISILVVDDHELFRVGLCLVLRALLPQARVVEVACAGQAVDHLRTEALKPDIVLLDWHIPGEEGAHNIILLRSEVPDGRLIVLSGDTSQHLISQCVESGASGFIAKNTPAEDLHQALTEVAAGGLVFPPLAFPAYIRASAPVDGCVSVACCFPSLTPRQQEVLEWVARGASNKDIARALGISDDTVKQHVGAILAVLGVRTRTEVMYRLSVLGVRVPDPCGAAL